MTDTPNVTDERLEELREAYAHLAEHPIWHGSDRQVKDAEHAALFAELQEHRAHVCPVCDGTTGVANPGAQWSKDSDGVDYCMGGEDMECPNCNGVGYAGPSRILVKPRAPQHLDTDGTELPF